MGEIDNNKWNGTTRDDRGRFFDENGNELSANGTYYNNSTTDESSWWKAPLDEAKEKKLQKEINAIGTPGERTIDDLLAAFQKGNSDFMKNSEIDKLDDESWTSKIIGQSNELGT